MYTTLILSTLLTAYKKLNNLKGYKIPKLSFALEMEEQLIKYVIELYGGNPNQPTKSKNSFWNTTWSSVYMQPETSEGGRFIFGLSDRLLLYRSG